ncbi:MAG: hypothetical protein ACFFC7_25195 [Candidatus Hermodarchaeota archaeon]
MMIKSKISLIKIFLSFIAIFVLIQSLIGSFLFISGNNQFTINASPPEIHRSKSVSVQPYWNKTFGWSGSELSRSMVNCSGGGYVMTGWTDSSGAGQHDAWLVRTDADGNHLWNYTFGGTEDDYGHQVIECSGGGFAIVGQYNKSGGLHGNPDAWLIRTDASGNHLWNETYGNTTTEDGGRSIVEFSGGGFVMSGVTITSKSSDVWLIHVNSTGGHEWNRTYGGVAVDRCYQSQSLVECASGGFLIAGYSLSYGPGGSDLYLVRTDSSGNMLWNYSYGGIDFDRPQGVIECSDGGFAAIGVTKSYSVNDKTDLWVVRTSANGTMLWNKTFGGEEEDWGYHALEAIDGGLFIIGSTMSYGIANTNDVWILRTDIKGNLLWNKTIGDGAGADIGYSIVHNGGRNFTIAGSTSSYGTGGSDMWLLKVYVDVTPPPSTTQTTPTTLTTPTGTGSITGTGTAPASWSLIVTIGALSVIAIPIVTKKRNKKKL